MPNQKKPAQKKPTVSKKPVVKDAEKESKSDLFLRLATPRVEKVLKSLRILGNCANRNTYEYTEQQVDKMMEKLDNAFTLTMTKFHNSRKQQESFKF